MAIFKKPEEASEHHAFEEQEQYQAPPEVLAVPTPEELEKQRKKKRLWTIGGISLGLFTVGAIVTAVVLSNLPAGNQTAEPTPTPLPERQPSQLEQELQRLEGLVDEADPATEPFAPPPVDMEVEF